MACAIGFPPLHMHSVQAGPRRAEPGKARCSTKRRGALQWDSGSLMQIKQQAPNRVFRIKTLHCRSLSSSTAAPQTCRRSPSPSRTQHSLPSKVKQINPHILTYPRPFSSHENDTSGSGYQENMKLSVLHKMRSRCIRVCILEVAVAEMCPCPHVTPVTKALHQRFVKVCCSHHVSGSSVII